MVESKRVPFGKDATFCYYCQTYHFGDHAKFAMPASARGWRKHWPDLAMEQAKMQAELDERRLLEEEGVEPSG